MSTEHTQAPSTIQGTAPSNNLRIDPESPDQRQQKPALAASLLRAPEGAHFFNKAEIMAAEDVTFEDIPVPEWSKPGQPVGYVRVRGLTAGERSELEAQLIEIKKDGSQQWNGRMMRQLFCAYAIIDPTTGRRLFSNTEIHYLGAKSAAATDRVYESATRQSRFSKEDMEELEGNLSTGPSAASAGGSENGGAATLMT